MVRKFTAICLLLVSDMLCENISLELTAHLPGNSCSLCPYYKQRVDHTGFLPGCNAVRSRVKGGRAGRDSPPVVPGGGKEGVLRRLPVCIL